MSLYYFTDKALLPYTYMLTWEIIWIKTPCVADLNGIILCIIDKFLFYAAMKNTDTHILIKRIFEG